MLGGRLWAHPDFLKLWGGQTISELGSAVTTVALPTVAVLQLHAGPFEVGLLLAAQRIAFPVLAPFVGVYIDRLHRRRVMILTDVGRMLLLASIPLAALANRLTIEQLYLVGLLSGVLTIFFDLAYLALLPGMIPRVDLEEGNTKFQMSLSVTQLLGPALAGVLIQAIGAARAIAVDAASYLVSWLSLLWISAPEPPADPDARGSVIANIRDAARHVFGNPVLRSLILIVGCSVMGAHVAEAVEYPFAYRRLGLSPGVFGVLLSLAGVGAVLGSALTQAITRTVGVGRIIGISGVLSGLALMGLSAAVRLPAIPTLALCYMLLGLADPVHNINQVTLRQALTPDRLQGRMNALFRTVYWGAWPLGNIIGGYLGTRLGLVPVMIGGGAAMAVISAAAFVTPLRRVGEHPTLLEEA
ncbi:MAG TPA: MFS transporter [Candidatus Limnocylindrales bacterium]|nr:MFS transporter [Candidatus Limnocylindrales bacterium]